MECLVKAPAGCSLCGNPSAQNDHQTVSPMAVNNYPPRLVLTAGESASIGPDLCVLLAQCPHPADIIVATAPELLEQRARLLGLPLQLELFDPTAVPITQVAGRLRVLPVPLAAPAHPGRLNPA